VRIKIRIITEGAICIVFRLSNPQILDIIAAWSQKVQDLLAKELADAVIIPYYAGFAGCIEN
jgi:hypothetical protein